MKRNFDILLNGQVDQKQVDFLSLGSIMGNFPLDALRSAMLILDIHSIEHAYIGHFDQDGKYFVRLYQEVRRWNDDYVDCEMYQNMYLSKKSYALNGTGKSEGEK